MPKPSKPPPYIVNHYPHQTMGWELKYVDPGGKHRSRYRKTEDAIITLRDRLEDQWASGNADVVESFDDVVGGLDVSRDFFIRLVGECCRLVASYPASEEYRQTLKALTSAARAMESYVRDATPSEFDNMTDEEVAKLLEKDWEVALSALPQTKRKQLVKEALTNIRKVA